MQMQLSKEFYEYFITFLEFTLYLERFEKKNSLMAQVFYKLSTPKNVVT